MKTLIILAVAMLMLGGCTKRAWYEGFQAGQRQNCSKLESPDRENCLKNVDMSYNEYQKNRK